MRRAIILVILITCVLMAQMFGIVFDLYKIQNEMASLSDQNFKLETLNKSLQEKVKEKEIENEKLNNIISEYTNAKPGDATYGLFKSYLDYREFDPKYKPYELQQKAITDERGFRRQGEYYFIAIGTGWGFVEGDKLLVVLSTGYSFKAIMGDRKSDTHTDAATHKITVAPKPDGSVVEFIVDKNKITKYIGSTGTISTLPEFKGAIVGIYKLS